MEYLAKTRSRIKLLKYIFLSTSMCVCVAILVTLYLKNTPVIQESAQGMTKENKPKLPKNYTLSINQSVFKGTSSDLLPYMISAQNISKNSDNKYILSAIKGNYSLLHGDVIISGATGTLDESTKIFTLKDNVEIIFNGATFHCKEVQFNLNSKDAHSNTTVEVIFGQSNIKADKFKTEDSCDQIKFEGNVETNFDINNK